MKNVKVAIFLKTSYVVILKECYQYLSKFYSNSHKKYKIFINCTLSNQLKSAQISDSLAYLERADCRMLIKDAVISFHSAFLNVKFWGRLLVTQSTCQVFDLISQFTNLDKVK